MPLEATEHVAGLFEAAREVVGPPDNRAELLHAARDAVDAARVCKRARSAASMGQGALDIPQ